MKRSGFKRKVPAPKPATQCTYTPRPRQPAKAVAANDGKARMVVPIPKPQPVRDPDYLRLVATLPCVWCGVRGFSQAAHANQGKGMATKSCDTTAMSLCGPRPDEVGCHALVDQGGVLTKDQRRELEELWGNQTRMKLRRLAQFDNGVRRIVERCIGL